MPLPPQEACCDLRYARATAMSTSGPSPCAGSRSGVQQGASVAPSQRLHQRLVVVPIAMVAPIVMVIVIVVPAMARARMRYRGRRKPFAARAIRKGQRRSRALLADALLAPIAHAVRESRLQPRPLRRREDQWRIVNGVERL